MTEQARTVDELAGTPALVTVPALLSLDTVARLFDCSVRTVRRRIDSGELPAVLEHGRKMVRADVLLAYIESLEAVGKTATSRHRPAKGRYAFL